MNDMMEMLPGLDAVRDRFLELLKERQGKIAAHAIAAWDAETPDTINANLAGARDILHQIAGSAGTLGFAPLGNHARNCETQIIDYLASPDAESSVCPGDLVVMLDSFTTDCQTVLDEARENIFA